MTNRSKESMKTNKSSSVRPKGESEEQIRSVWGSNWAGGSSGGKGPVKRDFMEQSPPKNEKEFYARYDPAVGWDTATALGSILLGVLVLAFGKWLWGRAADWLESQSWFRRRKYGMTSAMLDMHMGMTQVNSADFPTSRPSQRPNTTLTTAVPSSAEPLDGTTTGDDVTELPTPDSLFVTDEHGNCWLEEDDEETDTNSKATMVRVKVHKTGGLLLS